MKNTKLDIWTSENIDAYYLDHITEENHQEFSDIKWVKVKDEIEFLKERLSNLYTIQCNQTLHNRELIEKEIKIIEQRLKQLEGKE
jgi:hypothetical protein